MHSAGQIAAPLRRVGAPPASYVCTAPAGEPRAIVHQATIPPALAEAWTALAADAAEPNSFAEYWFVAAALATLDGGADVRIVEIRRGDPLIGVMAVAVERDYGRMPISFVQNWCHHQLFLGTPLVRRGEERAFWSAMLDLFDASDWATSLFHARSIASGGPVHLGLVEAARARRRSAPTVHRESRALLASTLDAETYFAQAVRPKKRKEIRRLGNRLGELGDLRARVLEDSLELGPWCDAFLALEKAGWKGREGSALACSPDTESFFRDALMGAWLAGRLQFLRLDLDDRPVALLVNFVSPPGSFSFKTAFDEDYARFSPGVLIQLENLRILERGDVAWMDSCACEQHPMIDSLWRERREIVRVTVRLKGTRRALMFAACRVVETAWRALRAVAGKWQ